MGEEGRRHAEGIKAWQKLGGLVLAGFLIHPIALLGVLAGLAWLWLRS